MKRHGHLFVGILDFDNLLLAARKAQRGKHYRDNVLDFNYDFETNLRTLAERMSTVA
jgi:RNA-directed DNA polymerase